MWTEQKVEFIKSKWEEGLSASQIARAVSTPGDVVSRNAVISKLHRLNVPQREMTTVKMPRAPRVTRPKGFRLGGNAPVPPTPAPAEEEPIEEEPAKRVTLMDLNSRTCRWPIGDPQHDDFHFCGRKPVPALPYCLHHCKKAYHTPSRARDHNGQAEAA